ncbi:MAG: hypothetical protein HZB46_16705 [Solirubrobacterales bacterium]|nr:hypothetical protein [Solirubrobacterales bacterium]
MPLLRFSIVSTVIALVVGGIVAITSLGGAKDSIDEATRKGGDAKSMFHQQPLDKALTAIRGKVGDDADLLQLAVYPGYVAVEVSTGSEDEGRAFKVDSKGHVKEFPLSLSGPGRLKDNIFPLAKLDAATVEKLAAQVSQKESKGLDDVTHVIAMIDPVSGKPGWNVYLNGSKYWRASLDGSGLSNPDDEARKTLDQAEKTIEQVSGGSGGGATAAKPGASDLATCIQEAGTDAAKIQACAP